MKKLEYSTLNSLRTQGQIEEHLSDEDPLGHIAMGVDAAEPHTPPRGEMSGHVASSSSGLVQVVEETEAQGVDTSVEELELCAMGERVGADQPHAHPTHALECVANMVWCSVCGRHAVQTLGIGLRPPCWEAAIGVYPSRLTRLRRRLHPISGEPL